MKKMKAKEALKPEKKSSLKFIARAFRSRNYRLYFCGQCVSLIGTWMQYVAMSWLVYRLTGSASLLGLVTAAGQISMFVLTPFTGVLVDRVHRRNLLITTQTLCTVQAALLAFLTLTGNIQVWHLVLLSLFLGTVNAFDMPARHTFVVELVEHKKDLGNAIALNSAMFNSARLVGPSIAGLLVAALGEGICFLLNSISFFAIIFTLLAMNVPQQETKVEHPPVFRGLKEGFQYALGFRPILYILGLMTLIGLMGMPYMVLMPVFARDVLHGGPQTFGFLMGASGIGALTGSLYLASRKSVLGLAKLNVLATCGFGVGIIIFSFSRSLPLSLCILLFTGFGMIMHMASSNTMLQTIVDEDKRGRVMSYMGMCTMGMAPFGSALAGSLSDVIGAPHTLIINGIVSIAGALVFYSRLPAIREAVRPIYVKMGIIKDLPVELQ
jgi:MFS family permease